MEGSGSSDPRRLRLVLFAAALSLFTVQLDFFALNLALPAMASELEVSTDDMQWVISGYMLALAAFLIPGGRLGDLLGRKRVLLIGLAIFGGASLAGGLAPSAEVLIAFRIVQGVGAAILFPLSVAVVSAAFPAESTMRAIGNLYGLSAIATALGPFVGGGLTELIDWRAVLLVNVPVVVAAALMIHRLVDESRDESAPRTIDLPGLGTVVLGIAAITYAVDRSEDWGFISPDTLGLLAVGLALMVGFVLRERVAANPLVDLTLFRNRPYVGITGLGTVANLAFVLTTFSVTVYLQDVEGYSALGAGAIFISASIALAISGPLSGWLGQRFDPALAMAAASGFGAIGLIAISTGAGLAIYVPALAIMGLGYGLGWSMASVGTQAVVPVERAGIASGVTLAIVIGTAGLGVAVVAAVYGASAVLGTAIEHVLLAVALGSVVLAALLLAWTRRAEAKAEVPGPAGA